MKKLCLLSIFIMALCSCRHSMVGSAQNLNAAKRMFEAFNQHQWQKMTDFYADDALFLDPAYDTVYVHKTKQQTAAKYAEMQNMFPDIHDEVKQMYSVDNTVVIQFVSSGTPKDQPTWHLPICTVLEFNGVGKIIKDATYYNNQ